MQHVRRLSTPSDAPLFRSRLDAGEDLYFKLPMGPREPQDMLIVVASDGAVEVAYPWAYLCGLPVLRIDPGSLGDSVPLATGRPVVLIDDGLLAIDALQRTLNALRHAGPTTLTVVAPALRTAARRVCRATGVRNLATLMPTTYADAAPRLYRQRPINAAVARGLLAEVRWDRPWDADSSLRRAG